LTNVQCTEDVAERAINGRPGRRDRPEVLRLALVEDILVEDVLNDRPAPPPGCGEGRRSPVARTDTPPNRVLQRRDVSTAI